MAAVPEELEETCLQCHEALAGVDRLLKPVLAVNRTTLEERVWSVSLPSVSNCQCVLFGSWTS